MKNKNENSKFHYIYFIEAHEATRVFNFSISDGFKKTEPSEIEFINEQVSNNNNDILFICGVYRFKMNNIKDNFEITILLKENNGNIFEQKINKKMIKGHNVHFFLYNFHFQSISKNKRNKFPSPSYSFNLTNEFQYQLYLESIKIKYKDLELELEKTRALNDLLLCTQTLFIGENIQFDFLFYISIFIACYKTKLIKRHLICFKIERITELRTINKEIINKAKDLFNSLAKNPEEIIKNIEENEKNKYLNLLYQIILYFNIYFQSTKVNELLDDDKINNNLFSFIAKSSHILPKPSLSRDHLNSIVKICERFKEIKNVLYYNKDCYDILFIINENKKHILEKYKQRKNKDKTKEKKEKNEKKPIELGEYIEPKINDSLFDIDLLIQDINIFRQKTNTKFIIFSPILFRKYLYYINGFNYDNILIFQKIINYIINYESGFIINDFDIKIHKRILKLIEEKKLKYIEILDFIQRDKYLNKKSNFYGDFSIFENIKLNEIDDNFIKKWKDINWMKIFKGNEAKFLEKICSLVENITQFHFLFDLLYDNKEFISFSQTILKFIQNEFIQKCKNETNEKLNEHLQIIINLIKYSDKKQCYIEEFIKNIIYEFNKEFIQNLFLNALSDLNNLSQKAKTIMINFIDNEIKLDNQDNILNLIINTSDKKFSFPELMKFVILES